MQTYTVVVKSYRNSGLGWEIDGGEALTMTRPELDAYVQSRDVGTTVDVYDDANLLDWPVACAGLAERKLFWTGITT